MLPLRVEISETVNMQQHLEDEEDVVKRLHDPETQRSAFSQIVAAYSEKLYWHIRKMVLDHEDANDILQNTFLKAWTNLDSFRGDAKLSTWMFKIAVNECITFLNKQRMMNNVPIDDADVYMLQTLKADEYFDGDEIDEKLQKAILTLPEKQRIVFTMKYYDDMKYEDMSGVLGTSVGALKASYHHAVKKIEALLTNDI
jgi:RNA polymerase sigma-70 factor (ECF subfamily)